MERAGSKRARNSAFEEPIITFKPKPSNAIAIPSA
jgi:hypothetical protein